MPTRSRSSKTRASHSTSWSATRRATFAAGHGGAAEERALFRAILIPLLIRTAEARGGFDWGRRLRTGLRRARALAVRDESPVRRARGPPRRAVGRRSDRARPRDAVHETTADEICARWPEARDLLPSGFGHTAERTPAFWNSASCPAGRSRRPTPRLSWPMPSPPSASRPARRWPRARSSSSGSTRTPSASGRCSASRDRACGRADPARPRRGEARRRPARTPCRDRGRHRARRGAGALGAVAVRGRPAPLRAAARGARRPARRGGRALGGGDAGRRPRRRSRP